MLTDYEIEAVEGEVSNIADKVDLPRGRESVFLREIIGMYPEVATNQFKTMLEEDLFKKDVHRDAGMTYKALEITPEMAAGIVLHFNHSNRDLKQAQIEKYKRAMSEGQWCKTPQGIAFYKDRQLADGQHRMFSSALSGTSVTFFCQFDFEATDTHALDVGGARSCKDALKLAEIVNAAAKAPMCKYLIKTIEHQTALALLDRNERSAKPPKTIAKTNRDFTDFVERHDPHFERALGQTKRLMSKSDVAQIPHHPLTRAELHNFFVLTSFYHFPEKLVDTFTYHLMIGQSSYEGGIEAHLKSALLVARTGKRYSGGLSAQDKRNVTLKCFAYFCRKENGAEGARLKRIVGWGARDIPVVLTEVKEAISEEHGELLN